MRYQFDHAVYWLGTEVEHQHNEGYNQKTGKYRWTIQQILDGAAEHSHGTLIDALLAMDVDTATL